MTRFLRWVLQLVALLLLAAPGIAAQAASSATIAIFGTVVGGSGKHTIFIAIWNESGFVSRPVQQIRILPGAPAVFQFHVPAGDWALSAFEDQNGNGILDIGAFGPREPSGFWRPFHAWRKPRFDDVSSRFNKDTSGLEIHLH